MVSGTHGWRLATWYSICLLVAVVLLFMLANATETGDIYRIGFAGSALSALVGVVGFIIDGKQRITALGLYNYSTALFVGFAGCYVVLTRDVESPPRYVALAVLCALIPQIVISYFARYKGGPVDVQIPPLRDSRRLAFSGAIALAVLTFIRLFGSYEDTSTEAAFIEAAAFAATAIFTVGMLWAPAARVFSLRTVMIFVAFLVYSEVFHGGTGRLRIIALACTLGILYTARFRDMRLKFGVLAATPVALFWLAQSRLSYQESLSAGASAGRNGLESMTSTIVVFSDLLRAQFESGFPLSWGYNLLSFPAWFIPDSWWPDAPRALGYELVLVYQPDKYGTGYSVVATNAGEAVYNFGVVGVLLMIPVVVLLLRFLDKRLVISLTTMKLTSTTLLWIAFWAMTAGAIADFTWSGQHTFLSRWTTRLPLLAIVAVIVWLDVAFVRRRTDNSTSSPSPKTRLVR